MDGLRVSTVTSTPLSLFGEAASRGARPRIPHLAGTKTYLLLALGSSFLLALLSKSGILVLFVKLAEACAELPSALRVNLALFNLSSHSPATHITLCPHTLRGTGNHVREQSSKQTTFTNVVARPRQASALLTFSIHPLGVETGVCAWRQQTSSVAYTSS